LRAGGAYLPLDPEYPPERLAFMLEDGGVPVLLASEGALGRLPAEALVRSECRVVDLGEGGDGEGGSPPPDRSGARSLAYVLYTSGSTGRPKGVAVEHRSVVRLVQGADYAALGEDEVFLQLAPLPFDASTLEIWGALLNGARLELFPPGVPSLEELGRAVESSRVTVLWLTAGLFHQMVEAELPRLAGVGQLLAGGDVLSPPHVARVLEERARGQVLVNGYGPTEGTTFTCCHRMAPGEALGEEAVPVGRPVSSTRIYLVDPAPERGLAPVPAGVPGELYLGGDGVARGYLGRPALTAAAFVPDPFAAYVPGAGPGARLYRTGDLARWLPRGRVDFLGRIDRQVKLRGFRIEPGEVEAALTGHPRVRSAVVTVREDRPGDRRLVAYVVPAEGGDAGGTDLRSYLADRLPGHLVPAAFVTLPELPLDPNGKVDRRALPAPDDEAEAGRAGVLPRGPLEELVAEVWSEVLGAGRVGPHDDFFELGGHSLLATRVVNRLRKLTGVDVPLRRLFEGPTVAELARAVEELRRGVSGTGSPQEPPLVRRGERDAPAPASFSQERLWFLDRLEGGGSAYNVPGALRLRGPLAAPALAGALSGVVARHEVLRTRLDDRDGAPVQVVAPRAPVAVPVVEVAGLAGARREEELRRLARGTARAPFDLRRGPLLKALLVRLGPADHALLLTVHHVVFDGWSLGVFFEELSALYRALAAGRGPDAAALPEPPVQYGDFASWQRERLAGEVLAEQLAWWLERLSGVPEVLELPADRSRPAARSGLGGRVELRLGPELVRDLRAVARERGATLFMVLLAGFQALLGRLAGSADVPVGTPVAGRSRRELERLVGCFVNTLVLRGDLAGDPAFGELVARTRETALEAWARQDLPFERLVAELAPERALGHSPLFQVLFALQNAELGTVALPGVEAEPLEVVTGTAKLDLGLALREAADGSLRGELEYDRDLFDATTAARWARSFRCLLAAAGSAPERRLSELPVLEAAARHQLLREWNATPELPSGAPLLHRLVALQAARTPEAVALVVGTERWSFAELTRRAGLLASELRARGLAPEERVGVCLERSAEMVVALLAVLEADGAYVTLDPAYPRERLATILEDAGTPGRPLPVLTRERLLGCLPAAARGAAVLLDGIDWNAGGLPDRPPAPGTAEAAPQRLAYLLYTSGSTGRPKGVAVSHGSAAALVAWSREAFSPAELSGTLAATSINF
ncbi:MAG TPA: amino acid adenylation domain-containing protein, partial [Thermoanaerobaculia bacterium]|nr:amino acid adenylation domain-containing protein [Thermoanaerobaculia bacterium]